VGAVKLRQRDRQVLDLTSWCSKVGDDPKEPASPSSRRLAVKAYIDLTYSVGQGANNLGLHKVEQPHRVRSNTARRALQRALCLAVN
jgi:hypothetical protein